MKQPIILAAFGTTSTALEKYQKIEESVKLQFPDHEVLRSFTSRKVAALSDQASPHPLEIITRLEKEGHKKVTVQSLHLLPAQDFHNFLATLKQSSLTTTIGKPLLHDESDFKRCIDAILPSKPIDQSTAILILAHGTNHPCWAMYSALEKQLINKVGSCGFLGVIEKSPNSDHIPALIKQHGFNRVLIIPFFLILGLHYRRDIMGSDQESWKSRLEAAGLMVDVQETSLAETPGIQEVFCDHIREALS